MNKLEKGQQISVNFKLKRRIETMNQLLNIIDNQPSLFWRYGIFPTAVIEQQKLIVLRSYLKFGVLWEIERILEN
jgi:hypothetical protein